MEISINDLNAYQLPSNCFSSHYKILSFLGEGSYGRVFKAREISTGRVIAVKKVLIGNSHSIYKKTIKEINLLKNLDHPNIVKYYDYFEEEDCIYLMMEYLEGWTLKQYINNNQNITEESARIIIKQLLKALSYLHYTCDICHRDVKPENMMFKDKNDINSLKLLDFGLSIDSFESKKYLENCGTLVYMAPELINNVKYTKGVDVWSVGIILYMLLMKGKNPFYNKKDNRETIIKNIKNNNVVFHNENNNDIYPISKMGKDLINKLLKKNPLYRYTIRSALEHPWITMNKFDKIPLTIYDKANIDEYVERLKIFLLVSIFLNHAKKKFLFREDNYLNKKNKSENPNDYLNSDLESVYEEKSKNKKFKISKELRKNKNFNMDEYEKRVKYINKIYHLKFIKERETMFNPKISPKKNQIKNTTLSDIIRGIKEKKENEDFSISLLENSAIKQNSIHINLLQQSTNNKKSFYYDEQKNSEYVDYKNPSKINTSFKIRNRLLNSSQNNMTKNKLKKRFSAMPKIVNNYNVNNNKIVKKEENFFPKKMNSDKNLLVLKNLKKNNFNVAKHNKKENEIKYKNDIKLFSDNCQKRKKIRTNSAKDVNIFFQHVERSLNNNNKIRKYHLPLKKGNLGNNNFNFLNKGNNGYKNLSKKLEKNIMNVKIILHKNDKEKNFSKNKINISSIAEQTQNNEYNQNNKKKFPVIP